MTKREQKGLREIAKWAKRSEAEILGDIAAGTWCWCPGGCGYPVAKSDLLATHDGAEKLCEGCRDEYDEASYSQDQDALCGW